jgi:hypothetical protein
MKYKQDISWYKNTYLNKDFNKKWSPHYLLHFPKGSLSELNIENIINTKENHYKKITNWLNLNNNQKINYYIYPSIKEKLSLMGDDSPGNAIWEELSIENGRASSKRFEIHVIYNEKCKFIGEHEDTHLLSLPWGLSIYLFCEGLAQYMENNFMGKDIHAIAQKLFQEKKLYPLEWLCDNNNWKDVKPIIIYPQSGSFSKFIIEKYGKDSFKDLYRNTSRAFENTINLSKIEKIYHKKIEQLESEWLDFLKTI